MRFVAETVRATAGRLYAADGDIQLRSAGALLLDAASRLEAPNGEIQLLSGTDQSAGTSSAGIRIDLRAKGRLLSSESLLTAPVLRLYSSADGLSRLTHGMAWGGVVSQSVAELLAGQDALFGGLIFGR